LGVDLFEVDVLNGVDLDARRAEGQKAALAGTKIRNDFVGMEGAPHFRQ